MLRLLSFSPEELPLQSILGFCASSDISVSSSMGKESESAPIALDNGIEGPTVAAENEGELMLLSRAAAITAVDKEVDRGIHCMKMSTNDVGPDEQHSISSLMQQLGSSVKVQEFNAQPMFDCSSTVQSTVHEQLDSDCLIAITERGEEGVLSNPGPELPARPMLEQMLIGDFNELDSGAHFF